MYLISACPNKGQAVEVCMKLFVIFTGGTIGSSAAEDGYFSPDASKGYQLLSMYQEQKGGSVRFDTAEPYRTLSENLNGSHIAKLISCVRENISGDYEGIIVTHGTDTIQYSAAALGYALGNDTIPVVLVSSNYILEDERANGLENFIKAVDFIQGGYGRGVFAAYRNEGEGVTIHRGTRLIAHQPYTDALYSVKNNYFGKYQGEEFCKNKTYREEDDKTDTLDWKWQGEDSQVFCIQPCVGNCYPQIPRETKAVILGSYHSGTINTESSAIKKFAGEARKRKIPLFLTGVSQGDAYESTKAFESLGIQILPEMSPTAAYMKLSMALSQGKKYQDVMPYSLGGDLA